MRFVTMLFWVLAATVPSFGETIEWTNIQSPENGATKPSKLETQLAGCWSIPAGVENADDLILRVVIIIGDGGRLSKVGVVDPKKTDTGRRAAKSAVEAVEKCAEHLGLEPGEYRVTFDPATMF